MKRFLTLPLLASLSLAPIGCAQSAEDAPLFAAMIMTKQQQASSIPTDSGILKRDPVTGAWQRFGPVIQMISSLTVDPNDPETVFLACGNGIAHSQDGGETWRMVTGWRESDALQIAIDPTNSARIYAATAWGVTLSRDGGETWQAANEGLEEGFSKSVVIDANHPDRLLLGNGRGLYESRDAGASWQKNEAFPTVAILRLHRSPTNPALWLAGTEGQGVWLSTDNAQTWRSVAPTLAEANVYAVAIDPFDADHLAAGAWDQGVWTSQDGGDTWQHVSADFPSQNITVITFDVNQPGRLWASTFEEGTFFSRPPHSDWTSADFDGAYVFELEFMK